VKKIAYGADGISLPLATENPYFSAVIFPCYRYTIEIIKRGGLDFGDVKVTK
jgi:hypothetical protein